MPRLSSPRRIKIRTNRNAPRTHERSIIYFIQYLPPPQLLPVGVELNGGKVCIPVSSTLVGPISVRVPGQDDRVVVSENGSEHLLLFGGSVLHTGGTTRVWDRVDRGVID